MFSHKQSVAPRSTLNIDSAQEHFIFIVNRYRAQIIEGCASISCSNVYCRSCPGTLLDKFHVVWDGFF